MNELWQVQKNKETRHYIERGNKQFVYVRQGSDVGHNSSFFPMTHLLASQRDRNRSQDFHYYLRSPWVILLAGGC